MTGTMGTCLTNDTDVVVDQSESFHKSDNALDAAWVLVKIEPIAKFHC